MVPLISAHRMPLGPGVAERFAFGSTVTDAQVDGADRCRAKFRERFGTIVPEGTVMVLPTMPDVAPLLTEDEAALETYRNRSLNLLCLSGLSGFPQVTMPLASRLGAPLGLSVLGPAGSDLSLVRLALRLASSS